MNFSVKHWQDPVNAVLGVIAALALRVLLADKDYGSWWRKRVVH